MTGPLWWRKGRTRPPLPDNGWDCCSTKDLAALSTFPAHGRVLFPQVIGAGIPCLKRQVLADAATVFNDLNREG